MQTVYASPLFFPRICNAGRTGMTTVTSRLAGAVAVPAALVVLATTALACPAPPSPVRDLDIPRFYGDAAGSRIDPAQKAKHEAAVTPLTEFLRHVTGEADKSLKRAGGPGEREAARCALTWIAAWAKGDAWLGRTVSQQGEYQRKWDLAGVALAYLKLRQHATAEERRLIEPWLDRFAIAARAFFDDPRHKRNNHWYWLGLALGATGLAIDSERHWAEARRIMADAHPYPGTSQTRPLSPAPQFVEEAIRHRFIGSEVSDKSQGSWTKAAHIGLG